MLLVHFHSIDDAGHSYGDISPKTLGQIKIVDGYVRELVEDWSGKVIIVADHGMHAEGDAGGHGQFRYEDLIVPYITAEGVKADEKSCDYSHTADCDCRCVCIFNRKD